MNAARLDWYFDFISPFAYLQWRRLRRDHPEVALNPKPLLFAAILNHVGQLGPAEIPQKRRHTYRIVLWQARAAGIPLHFPPAHPFNPLPALRLCVAAGATSPAIGTVFDAIWAEGLAGDAPLVLDGLAARLGLADAAAAIADPVVKDRLRANTDAALAAGVFGVPTFIVDGRLFWGLDALPMLRAQIEGDARVDEVWAAAASVAQGVRR